MGIFQKLFKRSATIVFPASLGTNVYSWSKPNSAVAYACEKNIAASIASLGFYPYQESANGRQLLKDHPLYKIFHDEPNGEETVTMFLMNMVYDYYQKGNVYLYKYFDEAGDISALFRLDPTKMKVSRDDTNQKVFRYPGMQDMSYKQILHIPSIYGFDGTVGQPIYTWAQNVFQTTSEIDTHTNNAFNNSLGKRLVIDISDMTAGMNLTDEQLEAIKAKYITQYTGSDNAGKPIVKSGKVKYETLDSGLPDNRATQLLENRQFQIDEISMLYGVPSQLLKGNMNTGAIEELFDFYTETAVKPVAEIFVDSFNKLLKPWETGKVYFDVSYDVLRKTSMNNRIDALTKELNNGQLTINEVRKINNLPPVEGGDTLFFPANLMPVRQDIIDAYMSSAKLKAEQLQGKEEPGVGSDKK